MRPVTRVLATRPTAPLVASLLQQQKRWFGHFLSQQRYSPPAPTAQLPEESPLTLPENTGDIAAAMCDAFCRLEKPVDDRKSGAVVRPLTQRQLTDLIHHALASNATDGDVTFCGRDLRDLLVDNTIRDLQITVEKLERMDFSAIRLLRITARRVSFERSLFVNGFFDECFFDQCSFEGCLMKNVFFRNCRFVRCSFSFASLENANVAENCSFVECELDIADMTRLITSNPSSSRIFDVSEGSIPEAYSTTAERLGAGTRFIRCHNWNLSRRAMWRHPTLLQREADGVAPRKTEAP